MFTYKVPRGPRHQLRSGLFVQLAQQRVLVVGYDAQAGGQQARLELGLCVALYAPVEVERGAAHGNGPAEQPCGRINNRV